MYGTKQFVSLSLSSHVSLSLCVCVCVLFHGVISIDSSVTEVLCCKSTHAVYMLNTAHIKVYLHTMCVYMYCSQLEFGRRNVVCCEKWCNNDAIVTQ